MLVFILKDLPCKNEQSKRINYYFYAMEAFIQGLPKAELHLHIEGTFEPKLMFDIAKRNGIEIPFATVKEIEEAYQFD